MIVLDRLMLMGAGEMIPGFLALPVLRYISIIIGQKVDLKCTIIAMRPCLI